MHFCTRGLSGYIAQHLRRCTALALACCSLAASLPSAAFADNSTSATRSLLLDAAYSGHALIAVGERGNIIRSVDSGQHWESISSPTTATLTALTFTADQQGWAVGHDGLILHTRDQGETWTEQFRAPDPDTSFLDIIATGPSHLLAIGSFGTCFETLDSGKTWIQRRLLTEDNHLNRATATADGTLFIAGERGTLLRLDPRSTAAPTPIPAPYTGSFYGILPLPDGALLAYGLRGHIFRSEDRGANWTAVPCPNATQLFTALRLKNGVLVLAGSHGRMVLISRDDGHTFTEWPTPLTTCISQLVEAPNGDLLAFGDSGIQILPPPEPSPSQP